jgi:hypothetical protein
MECSDGVAFGTPGWRADGPSPWGFESQARTASEANGGTHSHGTLTGMVVHAPALCKCTGYVPIKLRLFSRQNAISPCIPNCDALSGGNRVLRYRGRTRLWESSAASSNKLPPDVHPSLVFFFLRPFLYLPRSLLLSFSSFLRHNYEYIIPSPCIYNDGTARLRWSCGGSCGRRWRCWFEHCCRNMRCCGPCRFCCVVACLRFV